MISRTAKYALRAVVHLAAEAREAPVPVDAVAEQLDVPRNYLSKTLHRLAKVGILDSSRGPHGGFQLAASPSELTLQEVVAPFDEEETRRQCLLGRERCSDEDPCAAHERWKRISLELAAFYQETTVADLAAREEVAAGRGPDVPTG